MLESDRRAKVAERFVPLTITALLVAGASGCSIFADLDGLQNGDGEAGSEESIEDGGAEASVVIDAAKPPPTRDAGVDADAALTPIAFVQVNTYGEDDAGVSNITLSPVKPGNTLVVAIWIGSTSTTPTVTDDKGDTFTAVVGPYGSAHGVTDYIFASINVSGNAHTVTTTLSKHDALEVYALEYSGIGSFDVGISNLIDSGGMLASGYVQTKAANELIFAFSEDGSVTNGTGFTARSNFEADIVEDLTAGAPGPYEGTVQTTSGGEILVAAFASK